MAHGTEIHGRKANVQGDGIFSVAELQRWSVSCKKCNVHHSLLGPVMGSFLPIDHFSIGVYD